jgi:hypothetical protein
VETSNVVRSYPRPRFALLHATVVAVAGAGILAIVAQAGGTGPLQYAREAPVTISIGSSSPLEQLIGCRTGEDLVVLAGLMINHEGLAPVGDALHCAR